MIIRISLIFIFLLGHVQSKELGQTEITTKDGIEVYQKEKYYLLKNEVKIISDNLKLNADVVKAYFDKDLYDIRLINSRGNVEIESKEGLQVMGEIVDYNVKNEDIYVEGKNAFLKNNQFTMISNKSIKLDNALGEFKIIGSNSELITEETQIKGESIIGNYSNINGENIIKKLIVTDKIISNIKTSKMDLYAIKAEYDKENNLIKLFEKVKVIREDETITGDYAEINTLDESYKIESKDSERVKVILNNE
ncbi:MAG: hypothetical protein CFH19_00424 [Alphaproteobacteria bacterium MarineAlpha5_Bin9]|nr:MAG: hypothetical protein CFH19_00424 [Alphaproteobacteria bacterium MarineAlpha5_Bin9]